jgi:hypothetical protein
LGSKSYGRLFREAWIEGVRRHHPGPLKPGYVASWEDTPEWERASATAVCEQIWQFVLFSDGKTLRLTREQKGRFVATCWIAQVFKHFDAPKDSYVADWDHLPSWQRETDADVFESVEASVRDTDSGSIT